MALIDQELLNRYLGDAEYRRSLTRLADQLIYDTTATTSVRDGEVPPADPFALMYARRLADARSAMLRLRAPLRVGVVFAMWRERRRLQAKSRENPGGEDCLAFKVETLRWLFEGTPVHWQLYAVDDGCPEGSYEQACAVVREGGFSDRVTVMHLGNGFPHVDEPLSALPSVEASTKGGAIALGCVRALADGCDWIAYTDCDVSVHLGQLGSLLSEALAGDRQAVFGDRSLNQAFPYWSPARVTPGDGERLLSHVRRLLLEERLPLFDVPSPLKLFDAKYFSAPLRRLRNFDFSFDFELVMGVVRDRARTSVLELLAVDSFSESAWHHHGDQVVWYQKLFGIIKAARAGAFPHNRQLAVVVETYLSSPEAIGRILKAEAPEALARVEDSELGDILLMSVADIREWLEKRSGA
jgi:hypothetical protein